MSRTGLLASLSLFIVLVAGLLAPALTGLIPFPADIALRFPPWSSVAAGCCEGVQHAEMGDLATQFFPWHMRLNALLGGGELPIWNHHILMGTPFLAESTPGVFFPLNILYGLVDPAAAWTILIALRYLIIAGTTLLFARQLRLSMAGSAVAAIAFTFCGWTVAFNGRPHLDSAMWLPLMLWSVEQVADRQTVGRGLMLAVSFALAVLGGHPEVAAQVLVLVCLYAACRAASLPGLRWRFAATITGAAVLAVAFTAAQVFPTLEWLGRIDRDLSIRWAAHALAQAKGLVSRDLIHHPNADGVLIPEAASYIGVLTLCLAVLSWKWGRRRDVAAVLALGIFALSASFGLPPIDWLVQRTPVLNGLPNMRFLVGVDFAVAMLAGMGLSGLLARLGQVRRVPQFAPRLAGAAIVLALVVDFVTYARPYWPWFPAAAIFPANPTFDYLQANAGDTHRVAAVDVTYGSNFEVPYGLATATGYDFPTQRAARFLERFALQPGTISFDSSKIGPAPRGALALTGTRFFVATDWNAGAGRLAALPERFRQVFKDGMVRLFEHPDALPLALMLPANAVRVIEADDGQLARVFSEEFDPRREIILAQPVRAFFGDAGAPAVDAVFAVRLGGSDLSLIAQTSGDALLYVNETFYEGTRVTVDGKAAALVRANYAFTAVPLAAGRHTVRISYITPALRAGLLVSGLAWGGALLWVVVQWRRRRPAVAVLNA